MGNPCFWKAFVLFLLHYLTGNSNALKIGSNNFNTLHALTLKLTVLISVFFVFVFGFQHGKIVVFGFIWLSHKSKRGGPWNLQRVFIKCWCFLSYEMPNKRKKILSILRNKGKILEKSPKEYYSYEVVCSVFVL